MLEKPVDRKRKVGEDMNVSSTSQKRCRTPIQVSKTYGEPERDNLIFNFSNTNSLNSLEPKPAGGARREDQGSPSQGVGEDVFVFASSDNPDTPARIGTVRPHRRCTARLVGDQNNFVGQ